jgi:hypothetical protein
VNSLAAASLAPLPVARLLLVGGFVPAVFACVDYRLLLLLQASASTFVVTLTMLVFVVQIGLMGWLCGRLLTNPWWRWGLYLWGWVLVDLQLVSATVFVGGGWSVRTILPASLFAAQVGLAIVWAILGDTHWAIRLPACAVAGTLLTLPMDLGYGIAGDSFAIQLITLAILCSLMRLRGFRLEKVEAVGSVLPEPPLAGKEASPPPPSRRMQFSIRHVLIWTTSLALILGVLRFLELLSLDAWIPFFEKDSIATLTGGLLLACVFVVSLWAALGSGPIWLRLPILALALSATGFLLGVIHWCLERNPSVSYSDLWRYRDYFWETDGWYVAWVFLAGSLLAASLVILRVIGYRLVRTAMKPGPASQGAT